MILFVAGSYAGTESTAPDESYYFPYITGNILLESNFTSFTHADYGNKLENDGKNFAFWNIENSLYLNIFNNFALKNTIILRPVKKRLDRIEYIDNDYYGRESYLKRKTYSGNYDIVFEELAFEYKNDEFMLGFGKFNPTFGTAYNKSKYHGVLDTRIAKNYELKEKIGFYVAMTFPMFNLRGNFFHNDNTTLSNSLFGKRNTYNTDKGVGNKESMDNFSVTSDFSYYDLKFNVGIRRQGTDNWNGKAEKGYVFGIEKLVEDTEYGFGFIPFGEVSFIENYDGTKGRNLTFFTTRIPLYYGGWSIIGSYSLKIDAEKNFKNYRDYIAQITLGYKFNDGLMIDVSRSNEKESYKISSTQKNSYKLGAWGARLSYMVEIGR
jgi:hypothetical protein